MEYVKVIDSLPPEGIPIMTKIDDKNGSRNETILVFKGNLFWFRDMSMYIYYTPTHWRFLSKDELKLLEP